MSKVKYLSDFTPVRLIVQMAHFKLYRTSTMYEYAAHVFK